MLGSITLLAALQIAPTVQVSPADRWCGLRGAGSGWTATENLPRELEAPVWTVSLAGYGQSAPVGIAGRVFTTSIDGPNKETCHVECHRVEDGERLWRRSFEASRKIESTDTVSKAAPTPIVYESRIVALFESGDLVAFDLDGEKLWSRDLFERFGVPEGNHGLGSSLCRSGPHAIALLDHGGPSWLVAIDCVSGEIAWTTERAPSVSYTTPAVRDGQIVVASGARVDGYDARTGERRWRVDEVGDIAVPSPTIVDGRVIVARSKGGGVFAITTPSSQDGAAEVAWDGRGLAPSGYASPLVHAGNVLLLNRAGVVTCVDLGSGRRRWKERLSVGECWATPVACGDLVWWFGKEGNVSAVRCGTDGCEEIAKSKLGTEGGVHGVAAIDGTWILREPSRLRAYR